MKFIQPFSNDSLLSCLISSLFTFNLFPVLAFPFLSLLIPSSFFFLNNVNKNDKTIASNIKQYQAKMNEQKKANRHDAFCLFVFPPNLITKKIRVQRNYDIIMMMYGRYVSIWHHLITWCLHEIHICHLCLPNCNY